MYLRKLITIPIILTLTLLFLLSSCSTETNIDQHEGVFVGGGEIDLSIPSKDGTTALRLYLPETTRYNEGAPILIYVPGGYEEKDLTNGILLADDVLVITFLFPGVESISGFKSDGTYDYRGEDSIAALRDVILFASGELSDTSGGKISGLLDFPVLTDNVGIIGISNGGNLPVATAALYGNLIFEDLKYIIQWETPVSSQIACRDLGEVILEPLHLNSNPTRGKYFNPRYLGYSEKEVLIDHSDLSFDESSLFPIFYDGNEDGVYTYEYNSENNPDPDLDFNEVLSLDEDFPLDYYPDNNKNYYSRPVTHALLDQGIFSLDNWPQDIGTPSEANNYWDIREAVYLYEDAMNNIPNLEAMFLASKNDHVQSNPYKSHVRMAYEGWLNNDAWVKINPSSEYLIEMDQSLAQYNLPDIAANNAPSDWENTKEYTIPESISDEIYQVAAIHEMADRINENS